MKGYIFVRLLKLTMNNMKQKKNISKWLVCLPKLLIVTNLRCSYFKFTEITNMWCFLRCWNKPGLSSMSFRLLLTHLPKLIYDPSVAHRISLQRTLPYIWEWESKYESLSSIFLKLDTHLSVQAETVLPFIPFPTNGPNIQAFSYSPSLYSTGKDGKAKHDCFHVTFLFCFAHSSSERGFVTFLTDLNDTEYAELHKSRTFNVQIEAYPCPTIIWLQNNQPLTSESNSEFSISSKNSSETR